MTRCPIDGKALTRPATGRPPVYCSVACRRIDRRIASLESDRDSLTVAIAAWSAGPLAASDKRQLAAIETAIATATERQRPALRTTRTTRGDTMTRPTEERAWLDPLSVRVAAGPITTRTLARAVDLAREHGLREGYDLGWESGQRHGLETGVRAGFAVGRADALAATPAGIIAEAIAAAALPKRTRKQIIREAGQIVAIEETEGPA